MWVSFVIQGYQVKLSLPYCFMLLRVIFVGFASRKCLVGAVWAAANISLCENARIAEIRKMVWYVHCCLTKTIVMYVTDLYSCPYFLIMWPQHNPKQLS